MADERVLTRAADTVIKGTIYNKAITSVADDSCTRNINPNVIADDTV